MTGRADPAGRRALVVLPADFIGGAERVTVGLVEAAARERRFAQLDVFVLARQPSGTLDAIAALPGVTVTYGRARREYAALGAFARFLRGRRYDLAFATHVHVAALCCALRRAGLLRTRRLVTRESSSIFEVDIGAWRRVVPFLVGFYGAQDEIIHQTAYMQASFDRHTRGRLARLGRVVPNPVDVERVRAGARAGAARLPDGAEARFGRGTDLVWCGRLIPVKRPLLALAALAELRRAGDRPWHLHVVGDGPLRGQAQAAAAREGLADHVTWWGQLAEPWAVMARCRAGLLTSEVEGFPNVVLEMLAAGVDAVVATACAGDLDRIPGVAVAAEATPAALAAALRGAVVAPPPAGLEAFLRARTPAAFLAAIDRDG